MYFHTSCQIQLLIQITRMSCQTHIGPSKHKAWTLGLTTQHTARWVQTHRPTHSTNSTLQTMTVSYPFVLTLQINLKKYLSITLMSLLFRRHRYFVALDSALRLLPHSTWHYAALPQEPMTLIFTTPKAEHVVYSKTLVLIYQPALRHILPPRALHISHTLFFFRTLSRQNKTCSPNYLHNINLHVQCAEF
jgi:hypothetical protein